MSAEARWLLPGLLLAWAIAAHADESSTEARREDPPQERGVVAFHATESALRPHRDAGAAESANVQPASAASDAGQHSAPQPAGHSRRPQPSEATPRVAGREPSVQQVLAMAERAAPGLAPDRLRELARRARLAGLAPELRVTAERGFDQDLTSSSTAASDTTRAAVGDQLRFGATLTFELDRLVFAAEEVRLLSIERYLVTDRHKLLQEVVRLYFQRRRLLREQSVSLAPDDDLADSIREVEALLDALTNGAFSTSLRHLERAAR